MDQTFILKSTGEIGKKYWKIQGIRTAYRGNLKVDYSLCQLAALNMLTLTNSMRRGNTVPFTLNK